MKLTTVFSVLVLKVLMAAAASAAQTEYPVMHLISTLRVYTDPLSDENDCESGGGMIPEVNCHLREFGVNGVGEYTHAETTAAGDVSRIFKIIVTESADPDYDFKVEAFLDYTVRDGSAYEKFMNYWFSHGGRRGKMEIYPTIPDGNGPPNTHAFLVVWDSRVATDQRLTVTMHSRSDERFTDWSERQFAMKLDARVDSVTGSAELVAGISIAAMGDDPAAYRLHLRRTGALTVAYGVEVDLDDPTLEVGARDYECIDNGSYEVLERDPGSMAGLATCAAAGLTAPFSLDPIVPDEATLALFERAGFME